MVVVLFDGDCGIVERDRDCEGCRDCDDDDDDDD